MNDDRVCIACGRRLQNLEIVRKVNLRKQPWMGLALSTYPICEDYGLQHLQTKAKSGKKRSRLSDRHGSQWKSR